MILDDSSFRSDHARLEFLRLLEQISPEKYAPSIVKDVFYCLRQDVYPAEDIERTFGIEMGDGRFCMNFSEEPIGKLMYGAWRTLFMNDYIDETNVRDALWNNQLPQFFAEKLGLVYQDFQKCGLVSNNRGEYMFMLAQVPEILKRNFHGINWDVEAHRLLALGKSSREGLPPESIWPESVWGIRINGDQITEEKISMDASCEPCPIALAAGIPLYVKKLREPGQRLPNGRRYIIVRMMSDPDVGLAPPSWTYGGALPPAPPVLVARRDGIAFTEEDWDLLDEFETKMLDDGPRPVTRQDFVTFAKARGGIANVILEVLFPKGKQVRIAGLTKNVAINNKIGQVTGQYENGRVGIQIHDTKGVIAVKPTNLISITID